MTFKFRKSTTFTTNSGAFINQDLEDCYFGRFVDGKMMEGRIAKVTGQKLEGYIRVIFLNKNDEIIF